MGIKYFKKGGFMVKNMTGNPMRLPTTFRAEGPMTEETIASGVDDGAPRRAVAEVTVTPPTWQNHFKENPAGKDQVWTAAGMENMPPVGGQGTLFHREPGTVTRAFSAYSMRNTMPTLLGMAANEHQANWRDTGNQLPTHDSSLSGHSSAMVQKLKAKGLDIPENPNNPEATRTNGYDWSDTNDMEYSPSAEMHDPSSIHSFRPVPSSDVQAGFATTKAALRGQQFQRGS